MSAVEALILGIVQGVTEFLPVSSKGHLVIGETLLGLRLRSLTFEILVHVATLAAVFVVLWPRLWRILRERDLAYTAKLAVACLPVGAAGFWLKEPIERIFHDPALTGAGLLFTGTVLFSLRYLRGGVDEEPSFGGALVIGIAQVLALMPGVSRSGMTIAAGLAVGLIGRGAAEFSFLLSIPVIAAAGALQAADVLDEGTRLGSTALAIGFVSSFVFGIAAIRVVFRVLTGKHFTDFAYYCWAVGSLFLVYVALR